MKKIETNDNRLLELLMKWEHAYRVMNDLEEKIKEHLRMNPESFAMGDSHVAKMRAGQGKYDWKAVVLSWPEYKPGLEREWTVVKEITDWRGLANHLSIPSDHASLYYTPGKKSPSITKRPNRK